MQALQSLAEMRSEVLSAARMTGDSTFQGFVDLWLNRAAAKLVNQYDFPELLTRWRYDLDTTAPTPHTWAPYEVPTVPRDMIKLVEAHIIDVTASSDQPKIKLQIIPHLEFHRMVSVVNPPPSGVPSLVCVRRREGAREHAFTPVSGDAGIRVTSSSGSEASTLICEVLYYADANRTDIRLAATSSTIGTSATALITATHYGIIRVSMNAASVGRITIDNTAGTNVYALLTPWERTAGYPVLAFNLLPDKSTYDFHCTYKRGIQYMTGAASSLSPLPPEAHEVVVAWAKVDALRHQEDPDWKAEMLNAQRLERELIYAYRFDEVEEPHMVFDDFA